MRHYKKYTQQEMADLFGVALRNYQKWEAGYTEPNPQAAFHLCRMLQEYESKKLRKRYEQNPS
ncbi:MAG: helix-turn-helix transcriptional regulator [Acidobacteriota bacterium]